MNISKVEKQGMNYSVGPIFTLITIAVVGMFFGAFMIGRYPVEPVMVWQILLSHMGIGPIHSSSQLDTIVMEIRLPRILIAILVGSALASAGAAYQNVFRNPLVSPSILGASTGAACGAVLGMVFQFSWLGVEVAAFLGGLLAVGCALSISWYCDKNSTLSLILSGIVVAAFFQALISILKYLADPMNTLPEITFWLMGGFSKVRMSDVGLSILPLTIPLVFLYGIRWKLHVLSVGEESASALGISVRKTKWIALVSATFLTAAATSVSGIIAWIGLLVPHMVRFLVGADFSKVFPVSIVLGAGVMLVMDTLSRSLAPVEIQVGIITSLIGAPCFVALLLRMVKK